MGETRKSRRSLFAIKILKWGEFQENVAGMGQQLVIVHVDTESREEDAIGIIERERDVRGKKKKGKAKDQNAVAVSKELKLN